MDNRQNILNCALALFSAHGYDGVGVQEIASKAGIGKPTIYHYFGSKQGLLQSLMEEYFAILFQQLEQAVMYHGDLPLTLHRTVSVFFSFARNYPDFYRMNVGMAFSAPKSEAYLTVEPYFRKQFSLLAELFQAAVRDHGNMKGRHGAYAATFLGMVNTYAHLHFAGVCELTDEIAFKALHQYMHGIYS